MTSHRRSWLVTFAAAFVTACGGGDPVAPNVLTVTAIGAIPVTVAGASVGDSVRVRVVDQSGSPKAGASVTFAVTTGGGSVSPTTAITDAQGRAAAKFVAGPVVGLNTATARVGTSLAATFTVTTIAGPAATISIAPRIAFVDAGQRITPAISAADVNGNTVPASELTLIARTPSVVSIGADRSIAGVGFGQTLVVGSSAAAADSMLIVVTHPSGPVLQSDLTRLDLAHDTTVTLPVILDMQSSDKLGATTVSLRWDPTQLVFISQAEGGSGAGALVNATSTAQGVLTLAVATPAGLAGRIELRRITFKAASTVGKTGTLRLSLSELSAAGTFADLLPITTSVTYPLSIR